MKFNTPVLAKVNNMNISYQMKVEILTIISGFALRVTVVATTSAMSTAPVTAMSTMPTSVVASLSAFVFNLKSKDQHRMVREGANHAQYLYA